MELIPRKLKGVYEIRMSPIHDHRGMFMRSYDESFFSANGIHRNWVQENQSVTEKKEPFGGFIFNMPHLQRPNW